MTRGRHNLMRTGFGFPLLAAFLCVLPIRVTSAQDAVAVATYSVGTGARVAVASDNRLAVSSSASGVRIINLRSFELVDRALSNETTALAIAATDNYLAVGTSDGRLLTWPYADVLAAVDDGTEFPAPTEKTIASGARLIDACAGPTDLVLLADETNGVLWTYNLAQSGSAPQQTLVPSIRALESVASVTGRRAFASTSVGVLYEVTTGFAVAQPAITAGDFVDMTSATVNGVQKLFILDSQNKQLHAFTLGTQLIAEPSFVLPGTPTPNAITTLDTEDEPLVAVATADPDQLLLYDPGNGAWTESQDAIGLTAEPTTGGAVALPGARALVSTTADTFLITRAPFFSSASVSPSSVETAGSATLTFTFSSTRNVQWAISQDGDLTDFETTTLSGSSEKATGRSDAEEAVTETVEADLVAGSNVFWIVGTDTETQQKGHTRLRVAYDPPPETVSGFRLQFGENKIYARWERRLEGNVDTYQLYFLDSPAGDCPPADDALYTGTFDGGSTSPITVPQPTSSRTVSTRIQGVPNETTVCAYVRTQNASGGTSEPSEVLSERARETFGVCDQPGVVCGNGCRMIRSPITRGGAVVSALFLVGLSQLFRRRTLRTAATALALSCLLGATTARAAETETQDPKDSASDFDAEGPKWFTFGFSYGSFRPDEGAFQSGFKANDELEIRGSILLYNIADIGASFGFSQKGGALPDASGTPSGDTEYFTRFPIIFSVLGRLDIFAEQPVVPYAGIGYAVIPYKVEPGSRGTDTGTVFTGGLMILLDRISAARTQNLSRNYGVNDTYLTVQYDKLTLDPTDRSGQKFSAGFLLAF